MSAPFEHVFPAIRGVQAGRAYYTSMCPLHLIPKIFLFDEEEIAPDIRAQRTLNRQRVPELASYIAENLEAYVFSAITASIDGDSRFEPLGDQEVSRDIGRLWVSMSARFIINDGQHRRAAIEEALKLHPRLGDESIAVVFFEDRGLNRAQQMFTDLNQHAVRPSRSLGLLYDHRTERAWIAKEMTTRVPMFRGRIELERSTLGRRSAKMFTLSAVETATTSLLTDQRDLEPEDRAALAARFWIAVSERIPEWSHVRDKKLSGGEFRRDYICAHGLALSALAACGRSLFAMHPESWEKVPGQLEGIDWSRGNTQLWEGRAMTGGKISKSHAHVRLTTSLLKDRLDLPLSPEEEETKRNARGAA